MLLVGPELDSELDFFLLKKTLLRQQNMTNMYRLDRVLYQS